MLIFDIQLGKVEGDKSCLERSKTTIDLEKKIYKTHARISRSWQKIF